MAPCRAKGKEISRFIGQEADFLRNIAADHHIWSKDPERTVGQFLETVESEFFNRFTYRNPLWTEHFERTQEEHEAALTGQTLWGFGEKLCHKLNDVHGKFKVPKDGAQPTGLLEMVETFDTIKKKYAGQAYVHPGRDEPYTRDYQRIEAATGLVSRLSMFPDADFAIRADADRERILKSLPRDLDEIAQLINRQTGAEIAILAGWRGGDNKFHEHHSASMLTSCFVDRALIRDFGSFQLGENAALMPDARVLNASPRVYGAFDGSYKPWFPCVNLGSSALAGLIVDMAEYPQGDQVGNRGRGAERFRTTSPNQLPIDVDYLRNPYDMSPQDRMEIVNHILNGQAGNVDPEQTFQLLGGRSPVDDTALQTWPAPGSNLRYGPASRMYIARLMFHAESDTQAQLKKKNMLPRQPLPVNRYFAFPDIQELRELSQHHPGMLQLINATQNYDIVTPIAPPRGMMDVIRDHIPILRIEDPPTPDSSFRYLKVGHVPHRFINEANEDKREHVDFSRLIRSGFIVHKPTRTAFGGPWGVKWAMLVVLWLEQINIGKVLYPSSITLPEIGRWRAGIDSDIAYLSNLVEDSHERINRIRSSEPGTGSTIPMVHLIVPAPAFQPAAIVAESPFVWDKPWLYGMKIPKTNIKTGFPKSTRMSVVVPMTSTPLGAEAKKFGVSYPTTPKKGKGPSRTPAPSSGSSSPVAGPSNVTKSPDPASRESSLESEDDFIASKPTSPRGSARAPSDVEMQTGHGEKTSEWEDMEVDPVCTPEKGKLITYRCESILYQADACALSEVRAAELKSAENRAEALAPRKGVTSDKAHRIWPLI
ncbi:hypothetical protein FRC09_016069 [Ceratobasidium sp. 395]|nr:hypothetical protein FRC09_016069 [Ceratobasidium sp. 395]